jgi:hypothetical protein
MSSFADITTFVAAESDEIGSPLRAEPAGSTRRVACRPRRAAGPGARLGCVDMRPRTFVTLVAAWTGAVALILAAALAVRWLG